MIEYDAPWSRRQFVTSSVIAAGAVALSPKSGRAMEVGHPRAAMAFRDDPVILAREVALAAVDAAKRAGAQYADVRITRELMQTWRYGSLVPLETQMLGIGVRALYNGYWGFASGPAWTLDEANRLAAQSTAQAKINAHGKPRTVEWIPQPAVQGTWIAPIERDPLTVPPEELADFFNAIGPAVQSAARTVPGISADIGFADFTTHKMEKTFASTEGSLITQTLYDTRGSLQVTLTQGNTGLGSTTKQWVTAATGWEYVTQSSLFTELPSMIDEGVRSARIPSKPVDVGRFDLVCSASAMAELVAHTIAPATQLDRALGYEANAGGTSFLSNPLAMLGTFRIGAPLLNITANRSAPRGLATVRWDDEGVPPEDFTLVRDGILTDFQTTREQAAWLAPWYERRQQKVRSHGCANSNNATNLTMQHTPNISLEPTSTSASVDDLIRDTKAGVYLDSVRVDTDFQKKNGTIAGMAREVRNGKLGPYLTNATVMFGAVELWNSLIALGGRGSESVAEGADQKGQPSDATAFSISAVPGKMRGATLINGHRRA